MEKIKLQSYKNKWNEKLFKYNKNMLLNNKMPLEDLRAVDWRFLIRRNNEDNVCIIGGSQAIIPLTIAGNCKTLTYVNESSNLLEYIDTRAKEDGINNISLLKAECFNELFEEEKKFNWCCIYDWYDENNKSSFYQKAKQIKQIITKDGFACFFVKNKIILLPEQNQNTINEHTIKCISSFCRGSLRRAGYNQVNIFSPVPSSRTVPLFYLPVDSNTVLRYFVRNLFHMFFTVTPETRMRGGKGLLFAIIGIKIIKLFRLEVLLRFVVPEYFIVAGVSDC